jgi:hypothetical protein
LFSIVSANPANSTAELALLSEVISKITDFY